MNCLGSITSSRPVSILLNIPALGTTSCKGLCKGFSTVTAMSMRGGAATESVVEATLNLQSAKLRIDALSSYAVIAALLLNIALRLYAAVPKQIKDHNQIDHKVENVATIAFTLFCIACIISGFNTTIIFSLLGLYSKTALGLGKDAVFLEFLEVTSKMRQFGFRSMVCSLISLKFSFVFSFFLNFKGKPGYFFSGAAAIGFIISSFIWVPIIQKASLLFV
mmetsp:Transcript_4077/g.5324  ORF Transcript_4077/g.5324 Transcript_4077/m.5324 type:complete len:221 (+) Transcript_4077:59-721(+)